MDNSDSSFAINPREDWVVEHNRQVREVWETFNQDKPIRVPVIFTGARSVYADEHNLDYQKYYNDTDLKIKSQLEWQKRARELPLGDTVLGELPDKWSLSPDFGNYILASCFGCKIIFRPDAVPAYAGLNLTKEQCRNMAMPDFLRSGMLPELRACCDRMNEYYALNYQFMGRPVSRAGYPVGWGVDNIDNIFWLATDVRGAEIMADMYDDPQFVHSFLERLIRWKIELLRTWARLDGKDFPFDSPGGAGFGLTDHGIDMLSVQTYETFLVPLMRAINDEFKKEPATYLHHCGRGVHLFPVIKKHFGLTDIHALTYPLNDIARVRREMGHETRITAVIADSIIAAGPPEKIRQTVKDLLTPEVKGNGRLTIWTSGEARNIPIAHYKAIYEAVKEYGRYE